jgi:hypothetical protein
LAEFRTPPEWRAQNDATKYPFSLRATLVNAEGRFFPEGTFLDAALAVVGASDALYLSAVTIVGGQVTIAVGDPSHRELATGTFPLASPPDLVPLEDASGRPAGVLVSEALRLSVFQAWGNGRHEFKPEQTEFVASVCTPTPESGVRGVLLADGTLLTGDVWLVGADGVVLSSDQGVASDGSPVTLIRVDVVGDPLFRRRLCATAGKFATPRFITAIRFVSPNQSFLCIPDAYGNVTIVASNYLALDAVLRIGPNGSGLTVNAVGGPLG